MTGGVFYRTSPTEPRVTKPGPVDRTDITQSLSDTMPAIVVITLLILPAAIPASTTANDPPTTSDSDDSILVESSPSERIRILRPERRPGVWSPDDRDARKKPAVGLKVSSSRRDLVGRGHRPAARAVFDAV